MSQRHPKGEAAKKALYRQYVYSAKTRNIAFDLPRPAFDQVTQQNCFYCGVPPLQSMSAARAPGQFNGDCIYNGLDRVDNALGYTEDNVVACCKWCNRAKGIMSKQGFMEWAARLVQYQFDTGQFEPDTRKLEEEIVRIRNLAERLAQRFYENRVK